MSRRGTALALAAVLPACSALLDLDGYRQRVDAGAIDLPAAQEVGTDAGDSEGGDLADVTDDRTTDGPTDAATDGSTDAATDGPTDAATDASTDAVTDGATDAVTDGSRADVPAADVPLLDVRLPDVPVADVPTRDAVADVPAIDPTTPPSPVAQVAVGTQHACARLGSGDVFCWGLNHLGQLGNDDLALAYSARPLRVSLPSAAADIATGANHSCARLMSGEVYCWGRNDLGALGDGTTAHSATPRRVLGLAAGPWRLVAGANHTCALNPSAVERPAFCWGTNASGECGQVGGATSYAQPVRVPGVGGAAIAAGYGFTCVVDAQRVQCWGRNNWGELGDVGFMGAFRAAPTTVPIAVPASDGIASVVAGGYHACARSTAGRTWCWGRNDVGLIPGGASPIQRAPLEAHVLAGQALALGLTGSCVVDENGAMRCWGQNVVGENGDGTSETRVVPGEPVFMRVAREVSTGRAIAARGVYSTCAAGVDGVLRCWGGSMFGLLGDGRPAVFDTPVELPSLRGATDLAVGSGYTCALIPNPLLASSTVQCAGYNAVGQLGRSGPVVETAPAPVVISGSTVTQLGTATALSAGTSHACALLRDGTARCWGGNEVAQLGTLSATPGAYFGAVTTVGLAGLRDVSAGASHTCAALGASVFCAGGNADGQSGLADRSMTSTLRTIAVLPAVVVEVSAGTAHTCVRTSSHQVRCWGANTSGQCGVAPATGRVDPSSQVPGPWTSLLGVVAGAAHTCAWNGTGAWCWGATGRGQTARAAPAVNPEAPTPVAGLAGVTAMAAGAEHTCAIASQAVWCWGANNRGQLGTGGATDRATPQAVTLPAAPLLLSAGAAHTCAGLVDERVFCWGANHLGQFATTDRLWQRAPAQAAVRWR